MNLVLNQYSVDLTIEAKKGKLDNIVGRNREIERVIYLSLIPFRISTVSFVLGSSTITELNLLSSAASFSIYFLYSFIVVALLRTFQKC